MPIDLITLGAALLTGLLGGVHCLAMCGGIATGLAGGGPPSLAHALALNGGRVLGYVAAGAIVGAFGGGLLALARIDGLATALRIALGIVLLLVAARLLWPRRLAWLSHAGGRGCSGCSGVGCRADCRRRCSRRRGSKPTRCIRRC